MKCLFVFFCCTLALLSLSCKKGTTTSVDEKQNISLYNDFYPLSVGIEYTYSFRLETYQRTMWGISTQYSSGALHWNIISKKDSANYYCYTISQYYFDSTSGKPTIGNTFVIFEGKDSSELIIGDNIMITSSVLYTEMAQKIRRFYLKTDSTSIDIGLNYGRIEYKKDSGIVSFNKYFSNNGVGDTMGVLKNYRLINITDVPVAP